MIEREKREQAFSILREKKIDLWMFFVRESGMNPDPALQYLYPHNLTWQSALMFFSDGEAVAIVGELDGEQVRRSEIFHRVLTYRGGIKEKLLEVLQEKRPGSIALNYSLFDPTSDGLTHGMFLLLQEHLEGTPFLSRLVSAEEVVQALRSRKTPQELQRIKRAVFETEKMFRKLTEILKVGMSEKQVASYLVGWMEELGAEPAWEPSSCPAVFAGPQKFGAHSSPTERKIEEGFLLNIDFGIKLEGYCSDLQRMWYFLKKDEDGAPAEVRRAFETVRDAIMKAAESMRPGMKGWEMDRIAREYITSKDYDEYPHALGHQVGREAHDGAALLAPPWERYGSLPYLRLEEGMVFTLEPRINLPDYGVVSLEEMVVLRKEGAEFISTPQRDLWLVG